MRLSSWHVPIEYLSATAISMLVTCPEQFRLRRIKRIPETRGLDKFIGAVDHETHERNFREKITTGVDLSGDEMESVYTETWAESIMDEGEPEWGAEDPQDVYSHGQLMIKTYLEQLAPTVRPIAVESRFEEMLPGVPIPIVGYTDIEEEKRLIERKTSKTRVSKPKPQWMLQGRLYTLVAAKPVEWQIITRAKTPTVCSPETDPLLRLDDDHHDSTVLLVQQAAFLLNDYWCRYGPDSPWPLSGLLHPFICGYCAFGPSYSSVCVAWKGKDVL